MTTPNNRDVTLTLTTKAADDGGLQKVANGLRDLGKEAAAGAPGVEQLATDVEGFAAKSAALARQMREQQQAMQAANIALAESRAELAKWQAAAVEAGKATDEQQKGIAAARVEIAKHKAEVAAARAEIAKLSPEYATLTRSAKDAGNAASTSGAQIAQAFGTVGVRSAATIKTEILAVNQALLKLANNATVSGAEFERAFKAGQARIAELQRELSGVHEATGKIGSIASNALGPLRQMAAAVAGALGVQKFIEANTAMDSSERALRVLTGSASGAASEMAYLRDVAGRLGVDIKTLADAYVGLAASGKESALTQAEIKGVFEAVSGSMSVLGKSSADTQGALLAVQQIISKGKVSMEELRQQLAERLPGALQGIAKELGITTGELNDLVAAGKLSAAEVIPALTASLQKLYGTGQKVESYQSGIANATNKITKAFADLGQSGVMNVVVGAFDAFGNVVSATAASLVYLGKVAGTTLGFLASFDFSHPAESIRQYKEAMKEAVDEINRKQAELSGGTKASATVAAELGKQSTATGTALAGMGMAAQDAGNKAQGASTQFVGWLVKMAEAQTASERSVQIASKAAEATRKEGEGHVAIANALGTETEKRQAAEQAATANLRAQEAETAARQQLLDAIKAEALGRAEALRDGAVANEQRQKELRDLGQRIEAAQKDVDISRAQAEGYRLAAAAAATQGDALRDNSKLVADYAAQASAAQQAVLELRRAQASGADVAGRLAAAEVNAAAASVRYRDALQDQAASISANLAVKRASIEVDAASLRSGIDLLRSSAAIARAKGDEARAARLLSEAADKELQLASLLADAKAAEAKAALELVAVQREELKARGELTATKEAELKAAELGAKAKQIEADAMRQAARQARDLADETQRATSGSKDAGNAASQAADGFDQMGDSAGRAADGVERLTKAEKELGIVKRAVSTSTIDHRTLANQTGITDEKGIAAFSEAYGKFLQQNVTDLIAKGGIYTPQSYVQAYAGAMELARQQAANEARKAQGAPTTAAGASAPATAGGAQTQENTTYSIHRVDIGLPSGSTTSVNMATEGDSSALVGVLKQLGTDMQRAAV